MHLHRLKTEHIHGNKVKSPQSKYFFIKSENERFQHSQWLRENLVGTQMKQNLNLSNHHEVYIKTKDKAGEYSRKG